MSANSLLLICLVKNHSNMLINISLKANKYIELKLEMFVLRRKFFVVEKKFIHDIIFFQLSYKKFQILKLYVCFKAFCQWKHFFSQASDGLEKELHPSEEYRNSQLMFHFTLYQVSHAALQAAPVTVRQNEGQGFNALLSGSWRERIH